MALWLLPNSFDQPRDAISPVAVRDVSNSTTETAYHPIVFECFRDRLHRDQLTLTGSVAAVSVPDLVGFCS